MYYHYQNHMMMPFSPRVDSGGKIMAGRGSSTRARFLALSDVGDYVKEEITRMILNGASF